MKKPKAVILFGAVLCFQPTFAAQANQEVIEELKTSYVVSCKKDLIDAFGNEQENEFEAI